MGSYQPRSPEGIDEGVARREAKRDDQDPCARGQIARPAEDDRKPAPRLGAYLPSL